MIGVKLLIINFLEKAKGESNFEEQTRQAQCVGEISPKGTTKHTCICLQQWHFVLGFS